MSHRALPLALLLAAGCGGSGDAGTSGDPSAAQACVDRINALRASVGRAPLARWTAAEGCADSQARSDSGTGTAHGAFQRCEERAQNECPGWPSTGAVVDGCLDMMWSEGPGGGHYDNMTSASATEVACGFYTTSGGEVWAVQDFR